MQAAIPTVKFSKGASDANYSGPGFEAAGWYIVVERDPTIAPDGPFKSMAGAIARMDEFCSSRGLDNRL